MYFLHNRLFCILVYMSGCLVLIKVIGALIHFHCISYSSAKRQKAVQKCTFYISNRLFCDLVYMRDAFVVSHGHAGFLFLIKVIGALIHFRRSGPVLTNVQT